MDPPRRKSAIVLPDSDSDDGDDYFDADTGLFLDFDFMNRKMSWVDMIASSATNIRKTDPGMTPYGRAGATVDEETLRLLWNYKQGISRVDSANLRLGLL
ncbi:unnamed protein product [Bursaphelenchus xylophilus]|uniref:(pine wood nematode) hypothetical protein n=1 Tax=Bursaphelenchus xylophilus TaxID=6326 RepID=A0A1I7SS15_BURXY|nr:unnamed protein product [Bursaphelenchus xylophilus]CAG9105803.1 unnamed protein product [Bursaphelenchus xylophilus]